MLKRRNKSSSLPLSNSSYSTADGSGRSIHTEAPILKAARNASAYTRNSYIWTFTSLFIIIYCYRSLWYHYATTFLNCEGDFCSLYILPPHRGKSIRMKFNRQQLILAKSFRVDNQGIGQNDIEYKGQTLEYDSYGIVLNQYGQDAYVDPFELQRRTSLEKEIDLDLTPEDVDMKDVEKYGSALFTDPDLRKKVAAEKKLHKKSSSEEDSPVEHKYNKRYDLPDLKKLEPYARKEMDGQYFLTLRKYNVEHKKRRVTALVNRINLYAKGRKDKLVIRENRIIIWYHIVGIVFAVFSFILSLLIGQFADPEKETRRRPRGPGSRQQRSGNISMNVNMQGRYSRSSMNSGGSSRTRHRAYGGYGGGGGSSGAGNSYSY